jgi:hypothetical protein
MSQQNESNVFRNRRTPTDLTRYQRTKGSNSSNLFLIIALAATILLLLFMAVKLFEFHQRLVQIESAGVVKGEPGKTPANAATVQTTADSTKVKELELKVQMLSQLLDRL